MNYPEHTDAGKESGGSKLCTILLVLKSSCESCCIPRTGHLSTEHGRMFIWFVCTCMPSLVCACRGVGEQVAGRLIIYLYVCRWVWLLNTCSFAKWWCFVGVQLMWTSHTYQCQYFILLQRYGDRLLYCNICAAILSVPVQTSKLPQRCTCGADCT